MIKSKDPVATFNHYLNGKKGEAMPEADKEVFPSALERRKGEVVGNHKVQSSNFKVQ